MGIYAVYLDAICERRLHAIAAEKGRSIEELIEAAASEEALAHFRHRADDPGRPPERRKVRHG